MRCGGRRLPSPPEEGPAMRIAGRTFGGPQARLFILPAIAVIGCATWMMLPGRSDAEGRSAASVLYAQNMTLADPPAALTGSASTGQTASSPPETIPAEKPVIDGLKISSQTWRRGGLGSKALVTFTLRNANDYAVKDIEIACAFARRDGSHLTERRRVITDTVGMKSRKTYSGVLIGFVNVNANKAKCSPVTASRT